MSSNYLILCHPLLLLPSIFPRIRVFSSELALHIRQPKYGSFNFGFSISLSNEYSGLISFRIDWCDLAVQGTLKSFLQHHSLKASILQHSGFFMVQLSHWYVAYIATFLSLRLPSFHPQLTSFTLISEKAFSLGLPLSLLNVQCCWGEACNLQNVS